MVGIPLEKDGMDINYLEELKNLRVKIKNLDIFIRSQQYKPNRHCHVGREKKGANRNIKKFGILFLKMIVVRTY